MDTLLNEVYILLAIFGLFIYFIIMAAITDGDFWRAVFKFVSYQIYKIKKIGKEKKKTEPIRLTLKSSYDETAKSVDAETYVPPPEPFDKTDKSV